MGTIDYLKDLNYNFPECGKWEKRRGEKAEHDQAVSGLLSEEKARQQAINIQEFLPEFLRECIGIAKSRSNPNDYRVVIDKSRQLKSIANTVKKIFDFKRSMKIPLSEIPEDQKTPQVRLLLQINQEQAEEIAHLKDEIAKLKG